MQSTDWTFDHIHPRVIIAAQLYMRRRKNGAKSITFLSRLMHWMTLSHYVSSKLGIIMYTHCCVLSVTIPGLLLEGVQRDSHFVFIIRDVILGKPTNFEYLNYKWYLNDVIKQYKLWRNRIFPQCCSADEYMYTYISDNFCICIYRW